MPAIRELRSLFGLSEKKLSKSEQAFLEAELFIQICKELQDLSTLQSREYLNLLNEKDEKENAMLEVNFIRSIIKDILSTEEYTLPGIAYYSDTTEDVVLELVIGKNRCPSLKLARKIIELHRSVRPDLYKEIVSKVIKDISTLIPQNSNEEKE